MPSNSTSSNQETSNDASTLDLAQAFKEIQRGEQTASQLEANLSSLEAKLDAMLAGLESQEKEKHNEGAPETKVEDQREISDEEKELKMDVEEANELKHIKIDQEKGNFEKK